MATLPNESENSWARGCPSCHYGIISAPDLTGAVSLYLERMVQAIGKQLVFCECQAGVRYRVCLLNQRQKLIEEARRDPRMQDYAKRLTHPDIVGAEWLITNSYLHAPAPTIHAAGEPVPA